MSRQMRKESNSRYSHTSRSLSETQPLEGAMRRCGISNFGLRIADCGFMRSEVRDQRSEVRSQKSEVRGQRSEVRKDPGFLIMLPSILPTSALSEVRSECWSAVM